MSRQTAEGTVETASLSILHFTDSPYSNLGLGAENGKPNCYTEYGKIGMHESDSRRKSVPVHLVPAVLRAASDPALSAADIRTLAFLTQHADTESVVGADDETRALTDPRAIGPMIQAGASTVAKALQRLEQRGYIEWRRGRHLPNNVMKILLPSTDA